MHKTIFLGLGAVLLSTGALAQQAPAARHDDPDKGDHIYVFERLDADNNGSVSREEAEAARARHFAEMDTNKDGSISRAEFDAHHATMERMHAERMAKRHAEMFARLDKDKDGKLSTNDFEGSMNGIDRMFDRFDTNKDGVITREEMRQMHGAWHAKPKS